MICLKESHIIIEYLKESLLSEWYFLGNYDDFLIKGVLMIKRNIYTIVLAQRYEWYKHNCVYSYVVSHSKQMNKYQEKI